MGVVQTVMTLGSRCGESPGGPVAATEQIGPPHAPALLPTTASSTLNDLDFLQVRGIDEELHLDTRPLNDISRHKGRVGTPPPDRQQHTGERSWGMCQHDRQNRPGKSLAGCRREKRVEMRACFSGVGRVFWMCAMMPFPLRRDGVTGVFCLGRMIATLEKG